VGLIGHGTEGKKKRHTGAYALSGRDRAGAAPDAISLQLSKGPAQHHRYSCHGGGSGRADRQDGDVVVALNGSSYKTGDVVAFYYNNSILVKRVIATSGDWVDIDEDGNVFVNGELLDEPYVSGKALGECTIELPYQVPEGKFFLLGDHRATSVDSRSKQVGCIGSESIVGRLIFRVWPLSGFGPVG
jgi:signal peptidase I